MTEAKNIKQEILHKIGLIYEQAEDCKLKREFF